MNDLNILDKPKIHPEIEKKSKEIGFGKIMMPLRVALVGSLQGPDIFRIIEIIRYKCGCIPVAICWICRCRYRMLMRYMS